jgi:hypothetical protein
VAEHSVILARHVGYVESGLYKGTPVVRHYRSAACVDNWAADATTYGARQVGYTTLGTPVAAVGVSVDPAL